ncbi:MAG: hypothetical protein ACYTDW_14470 [Planctomycetota bacterium]|jgi:hypothetical protein
MAKDGKKRDAGVEFLKGIIELVPEEKRKAVEESLMQDKVLDVIGDGALRQSDYSRSMDALKEDQKKAEYEKARYEELYGKNVAWIETNKSAIDKFQADLRDRDETIARLKKRSRTDDDLDLDDDDLKPTPPAIDTSNFVTREDHDKALAGLERDALNIIPLVNQLTMRHYKTYGDILDSGELFKHAAKTGLALDRAYEDMTKDTAKKQQDDEITQRIEAAKKEGIAEGLKQGREGGGLPYIVANNEPRTMDGLTAEDKGQFGVKAAVDEYYKSQQPPPAGEKPPSES